MLAHDCDSKDRFLMYLAAEAVVAGWGRTESGYLSDVLREAKVTLATIDDCYKALQENFGKVPPLQHQLCAHNPNDMGVAPGDSGGPMFQLREKGNVASGYVQIGVVSGDATNHLAKYTKVADYAGWINRRVSNCGNYPISPFKTNETRPPPTFPTRNDDNEK